MKEQNPENTRSQESNGVFSPTIRSRFFWLVIPAVIGLVAGGNTLTWVLGNSPSDPFGTIRASGFGGTIGLLFGIICHILSRPKR